MNELDATDPSDWNQTKIPSLKGLDSSLRCLICHEYFRAPLITSCSHTFCSFCIRDYLREHPMCPACRAPEQESRLRKNTILEEILESFKVIRPTLFEFLKVENVPKPVLQAPETVIAQDSASGDEEWEDDLASNSSPASIVKKTSRDSKKRKREDLVHCPACSNLVPHNQINQHLDSCLNSPSSPSSSSSPYKNKDNSKSNSLLSFKTDDDSITKRRLRSFNSADELPLKDRVRLPKLTYALLSESKIRSKLSEMGLPTDGHKQLLQRRHAKWVTLYNSNLDQKQPVSKRNLIRQLIDWERVQSKSIGVEKEKLGGGDWEKAYAEDFADLINRAKQSTTNKNDSLRNTAVESSTEPSTSNGFPATSVSPPLTIDLTNSQTGSDGPQS
ncbi:Postreplication repair E3 ubiquitin-protein ligase rad18 [Schizosaccharomyces pombe]